MIAGLLLAAGGSRRLGEPKALLLDATGEPLVARVVQQMGEAGCAEVVVVTGAARDRVRAALARTGCPVPVTIVEHDGWADGMGTSIACGIRHLAACTTSGNDGTPGHPTLLTATTAALIAAVDMPSVSAGHLAQLCVASDGATRRAASTYAAADGSIIRGIPAVLPRADWPWLAALDGDRGARALFADPATALVPLPDGALDLDTPADVARWRAAHGRLSNSTTSPHA